EAVFFPPHRQLNQGLDIKDQSHFARAEDGGATDAAQMAKQLPQWFDHRLELAMQLIDNDACLGIAGRDDDDVFSLWPLAVDFKEVAQPDEGQYLTAQVQHMTACAVSLEVQTFHNGIQGDHV